MDESCFGLEMETRSGLQIQFTAFLILMEKITRIEKVIDRDMMMKAVR